VRLGRGKGGRAGHDSSQSYEAVAQHDKEEKKKGILERERGRGETGGDPTRSFPRGLSVQIFGVMTEKKEAASR